jgi:Metal binding domain of Ada
MTKKVALICTLLVCVIVLATAFLSIGEANPRVLARSVSNTQSTSAPSATHVTNNPSIKALKPSAPTTKESFRRQSYSGPFSASLKSPSKKYHYPGCFEVANIDTENLVSFNTVAQACAAGYNACSRCNPPTCSGALY